MSAYARAESYKDIQVCIMVIPLILYHEQLKCACYHKTILQCKAKRQFCLLYK